MDAKHKPTAQRSNQTPSQTQAKELAHPARSSKAKNRQPIPPTPLPPKNQLKDGLRVAPTQQQNSSTPNNSYYNPPDQQGGQRDCEDIAQTLISQRPPHEATAPPQMSYEEFRKLGKQVCRRVWEEDLRAMWERVRDLDSHCHISPQTYSELLEFFFVVCPLIERAVPPRRNPLLLGDRQLLRAARLLERFGEAGSEERRKMKKWGSHKANREWYERPARRRFGAGEVGERIMGVLGFVKGKSGRG